MDEIKFWGSVILITITIFVMLFGVIPGASIIFEKNYCRTMTELNTNFEFKWVLWGGCLVQTPSGYWIHASEYKYLEGNIQENK